MPNPDPRTVIVTGAAGFIGGRVAERLSLGGSHVVALDLAGRSFDHLAQTGIEIRSANVADSEGLVHALAGTSADAVVHCAALMGAWGSRSEYFRVNVSGTRNMLTWSAAAGVSRFLYISSVSVYGMPPLTQIHEEIPFKHIGLPYADSKIEAEALVRRSHESGLPSTILRPGDVYGPRSSEWVVKLVESMKAGRMILIGGGKGLINLTYVDNLVDAIEAALALSAAAGRDYIITDGAPVTWKEYLQELARAAGCPPPILSLPVTLAGPVVLGLEAAGRITGRRPPLSRMGLRLLTARCTYSIGRAGRELDWTPRIDFAQGMSLVAEWLRNSAA